MSALQYQNVEFVAAFSSHNTRESDAGDQKKHEKGAEIV
jgi:hypothetical protein